MPATTTISADAPIATLVNVFTVQTARQRPADQRRVSTRWKFW